jgi:hypothetical protein
MRIMALALAVGLAAAPTVALAVGKKTHLGGRPSDMVTLEAQVVPNNTASFDVISPNGTHTPFALPAGQVLIVTDLVARPINSAQSGRLRGSVRVTGGTIGSLVFDVDTTAQASQHIGLTAGTVMRAVPEVSAEAGSPTVLIYLYGYLAQDK